MERCKECKMCDAIISIERRVAALEGAKQEEQATKLAIPQKTTIPNATEGATNG